MAQQRTVEAVVESRQVLSILHGSLFLSCRQGLGGQGAVCDLSPIAHL